MREIKLIVVHCSTSEFGDAEYLNRVATEKGFSGADGILGTQDDISYHYVIMNGKRTAKTAYDASLDGKIETGRPIEQQGAHCPPNKNSIGICLIGNKDFTDKQIDSLVAVIERLRERFGLIPVKGHYEMASGIKQGKTCPNIDMVQFRKNWSLN